MQKDKSFVTRLLEKMRKPQSIWFGLFILISLAMALSNSIKADHYTLYCLIKVESYNAAKLIVLLVSIAKVSPLILIFLPTEVEHISKEKWLVWCGIVGISTASNWWAANHSMYTRTTNTEVWVPIIFATSLMLLQMLFILMLAIGKEAIFGTVKE